jgi:hypothetical protein
LEGNLLLRIYGANFIFKKFPRGEKERKIKESSPYTKYAHPTFLYIISFII